MCRIAGIIDFNKSLNEKLEDILISTRDSMTHGGPDDCGSYIDPDKGIALGHRRLSIIDTSNLGHQPMSNKDKTIWITYNGEIYNFHELKKDLINLGYNFTSKTDTEAIIHGYEAWGIEKLLSYLRGMFAFAIYDKRNNLLFLARDRFGIKPLYYYHDNKKFVFASEVRALLKSKLVKDEKNMEALTRFLQLGSVPVPLTTIKNIYSMLPGHYMIVNRNQVSLKQYWNLLDCFTNNKNSISQNKAITQTRNLLEESVKLHLISDVPLGVFLSGGIDSSALVALASRFRNKENPLTTLSVIFDEPEYDESQYARLIASKYKTDHREILLRKKDFFEELPNIFNAMDQPSIDGVNTYFISRAAKKAGLTVVLSGAGGDEVFLGYKHFKKARFLESSLGLFGHLPNWVRKKTLNVLTRCGSIVTSNNLEKLNYLNEPKPENAYLMFRGLFTPSEIQALLGIGEKELKEYELISDISNGVASKSFLEQFDFLEFKHYLQDQILKDTDFMSMNHAIEIRVPFLDHFLVEYVVNLPANLKLQGNMNKPLLIKALGDDLPKEIWNRPKMGFTFPFGKWMRENCEEIQQMSNEQDLFDKKTVGKLWEKFKAGHLHWSRVWALVVADKFVSLDLSLV